MYIVEKKLLLNIFRGNNLFCKKNDIGIKTGVFDADECAGVVEFPQKCKYFFFQSGGVLTKQQPKNRNGRH